MSAAHTPEPWETRTHSYGDVRDALGIFKIGNNAAIVDSVFGRNIHESDANAARIVACVNACAGIPSDKLVHAGLVTKASALHELAELRAQNAELVAALNHIAFEPLTADMEASDSVCLAEAVRIARAALAKVQS